MARTALQEDPRSLRDPPKAVVSGTAHQLFESPVRTAFQNAPSEEDTEARTPDQRQEGNEARPVRRARFGGYHGDHGGHGTEKGQCRVLERGERGARDGVVRVQNEREEGCLAPHVEEFVGFDDIMSHNEPDERGP